jgi:hypothetical protein
MIRELGTLNLLAFRLHRSARLDELSERLTTNRELPLVLFDFPHQLGVSFTALPGPCEFVRGLWDSAFKPRLHHTLGRTGERSQEIGGCLTFRTLKSHVGEEFPGFVGASKVDLSSFVQNSHFVKYLEIKLALKQRTWAEMCYLHRKHSGRLGK